MTSRCADPARRARDAGTTLLEVLVVLAVLTAVAGAISAAAPRRDLEATHEKRRLALADRVTTLRIGAVARGEIVSVDVSDLLPDGPGLEACPHERTDLVRFFPDGSVAAPRLCDPSEPRRWLEIDWLTGAVESRP